MNPYVTDPSLYGQYYTMGQNPHGGHHGAYAAYYNAAAYASAHNSAAAAHAVATVTGQPPVTAAAVPGYATTNSAQIVPQVNHNPQNALTTIHPAQSRNSSLKQDVISTTPANSSIHNAMSTWQQVKQEGITIASPKSASIYFQTKPFVKASTKEVEKDKFEGNISEDKQCNSTANSYDPCDGNQICSKLHELAVVNRLVEVYEKIDCELSPGIHGVRLKLGVETYQGTGRSFPDAKRNAASIALAQTKYQIPKTKPTIKSKRIQSRTSLVYQLAQQKGIIVKFNFLKPFGFECKKHDWNKPKDELRGNYEVLLSITGTNIPDHLSPTQFIGTSDLPQSAKQNASSKALHFIRQLPNIAPKNLMNEKVRYFKHNGPSGGILGNVVEVLNLCSMAQKQELVCNLVRDDGPLHSKFTMSLSLGGYNVQATGKSKRIAKTIASNKLYKMIPQEWKIVGKKSKPQPTSCKKMKMETSNVQTSRDSRNEGNNNQLENFAKNILYPSPQWGQSIGWPIYLPYMTPIFPSMLGYPNNMYH